MAVGSWEYTEVGHVTQNEEQWCEYSCSTTVFTALSSTARIFRQQGQLPGVCEQLLLSMEMAVGEDSAVPVGV